MSSVYVPFHELLLLPSVYVAFHELSENKYNEKSVLHEVQHVLCPSAAELRFSQYPATVA